MFRRPAASQLVQDALRAGISHASLTYGNMGFARGAKVVATDVREIPFDTLPVCVELVAPRPLLDQFVHEHAKALREATLVMHEGVHLRPSVEGQSAPTERVEYVRVGASPESGRVPLEQVQAVLGGGSTSDEG